MANYSFTVVEGSGTVVRIRAYGITDALQAKAFLYRSSWVEESTITVNAKLNELVMTIPVGLATSAGLPAKYKITASSDDWDSSHEVAQGQIFFEKKETTTAEEEPVGVAGGVAALDADGDVVNAKGEKVYANPRIITLDLNDPLPEGLQTGTVILRAATIV